MPADMEPSPLYGPGSRQLQDQFDSRRLADRLVELTLHSELNDDDIALVKDQSTVFISTVDADGWPDVSYKGGSVGFVRVVSPTELLIPNYDGNGMWRTYGNIVDNGRVGLLFLDTTRPWRMRVHGSGSISVDPADLALYPGATAVLRVRVLRVFPNCGRYIHTDEGISKYVPAAGYEPPAPAWKQLPMLNDVLPSSDPSRFASES